MIDQFSNLLAVVAAARRAAKNLIPPPDVKPSAWAEQNVLIPIGNAIPGQINFDNAPYQRGMIDVIKEHGITRASYMLAAQTGKTTMQQCIAGYFIAHEPRSQMFVQPTQGDVQTFLETKLKPMLEANPKISEKMAKPRGRNGVNNSRIISYIGGWLMFAWAGSPKTLRGRSAPVTQADEIDGMETTAEGDPVQLLVQRSATFGDQRLLVESSTPTIKGISRIEASFDAGDQRRYYVPCPECGEHQVLKWENVQWVGKDMPDGEQRPETAAYACPHCSSLWDDGQRISAIRKGEWRATKPFKGHASFHLPELASTFRKLRDIVQSYLDKIAVGDLQSFINVSLAETYEEKGESADPNSLMNRCEGFPAQVPMGGMVLTAGVDMQQDRLEVEIVAWGTGEESWSVDYAVLWGDPLTDDPWDELEALLSQTWTHETGAQMPLSATCVDTGGTEGMTQAAYDWLKGKTGKRIFGIKGVGGWGRPIVASPSRKQSGKNARKIDLFLVGVDEAKLVIMRRLAVEKHGAGFCHFPDDRDGEYFAQLTAEKLVTRYSKGFPIREWHKKRERNEALDVRVYAYSALKIVNPSFKRAKEKLGLVVSGMQETKPKADETAPQKPSEEKEEPIKQTTVIKRSSRVKKRGGWVNNW